MSMTPPTSMPWLEVQNAMLETGNRSPSVEVLAPKLYVRFKYDRTEEPGRWYPVNDAGLAEEKPFAVESRIHTTLDGGRTCLGRLAIDGTEIVCEALRFLGPDRPAR